MYVYTYNKTYLVSVIKINTIIWRALIVDSFWVILSESIPNTWSFAIYSCCSFGLEQNKSWELTKHAQTYTHTILYKKYWSVLHQYLHIDTEKAFEPAPNTKSAGKLLRSNESRMGSAAWMVAKKPPARARTQKRNWFWMIIVASLLRPISLPLSLYIIYIRTASTGAWSKFNFVSCQVY